LDKEIGHVVGNIAAAKTTFDFGIHQLLTSVKRKMLTMKENFQFDKILACTASHSSLVQVVGHWVSLTSSWQC
jgi:hypothetical protein